jgi:hypothetical protein
VIRVSVLPAETAADFAMCGCLTKPKRDKLRVPENRTEPAMGTLKLLKSRREHIHAKEASLSPYLRKRALLEARPV